MAYWKDIGEDPHVAPALAEMAAALAAVRGGR
jgi:hypothetical protein